MSRIWTLLVVLLAAPALASTDEPVSPPTALLLRIGSFFGESYHVEIVPGSSVVVYRHNPEAFTDAEGTKEEKIEIPKERWSVFRTRLEEGRRYGVRPWGVW